MIHNRCNGRSSTYGASKISSWLSHSPRWGKCLINHGIWDSVENTSHEDYKKNLELELEEMSFKCDEVILITTTRIPVNTKGTNQAKVDALNSIMVDISSEKNIKLCDLGTYSKGLSGYHLKADYQNDVHYVPEGSKLLGDFITDCVNQ